MSGRAQHTPGPWVAFESGKTRAVMKGPRPKRNPHRWPEVVAWSGFDGADVPERQKSANLRLIAAAPDLLEALEALDRLREGCAPDELGAIAGRSVAAFVEQYRAAIAKAKGQP